ncbi:UNVERIFIED_CONTAM: hypothetical protein RMT77_000309 [Armadillidium vulgare]
MIKVTCASAALLVLLTLFIGKGAGIKCWDCNSKNDPRCGALNFSPYSIGSIDCDQKSFQHLKGQRPKYCRKIIQNIGEETRTIRGCGWLDDKRAEGRCYTRTGTKDIMVTFCQCSGDMCNTASSLVSGTLGFLTLHLLFVVIIF